MPNILLFRHGETQWNRQHRVQGQTDAASPLTLNGAMQARAYGKELARFLGADITRWAVVGSPLARCVQTISILCDEAGLDFAQTRYDDRLKEVDCGTLVGQLRSDVERINPGLFDGKGSQSWYFRTPGGETLDDMALRLGSWLDELPPGSQTIVVSHGVAGKVIRGLYAGQDMEDALAVDSPQNAFFVLSQGKVVRHSCEG